MFADYSRVLITPLMILTLLNGCSDSEPDKGMLDSGSAGDVGTVLTDGKAGGDKMTGDLMGDGLQGSDVEPSCGPGVYPCSPYGTKVGDTVDDLSLQGFADPQFLCKASKDQVQDTSKLILHTFRKLYQGDPACASIKKKLLWIMVGAGWCDPCKDEVKEVQQLFASGELDDRVVPMSVVIAQDVVGQTVNEAFLRLWVDNLQFKLSFPVAMDPKLKMSRFVDAAAIPYNLLVELDTMTIVAEGLELEVADVLAAITAHLP